MKLIFIAFVLALTSSSLLIQEQTGSVVPESQKRDITIPSANGDPIRISYGENVGSVKVDGNKIANSQDLISAPKANRQLQNTDGEAAVSLDADAFQDSDTLIVMSEDDVVSSDVAEQAQNALNSTDASLLDRANAVLILLTPIGDATDDTNLDGDTVTLDRDQINLIRATIALLTSNIPTDNLADVVEVPAVDDITEVSIDGDSDSGSAGATTTITTTVTLPTVDVNGNTIPTDSNGTPLTDANDNAYAVGSDGNVILPASIGSSSNYDGDSYSTGGNRRRRVRRAKALRRVSRVRAAVKRRVVVRRRHRAMSMRARPMVTRVHRAMSIRNHAAATRNHRVATIPAKRRVLRLPPPHFVRYNPIVKRARHLMINPFAKAPVQVQAQVKTPIQIEAQAKVPVAENKEVV